MNTSPKFVGLNTCFPFHRIRNLLAIVTTAATTARRAEFVRKRRQSERPEMSALLGSNSGSFQRRVQAYCERRAEPRMSAARPGVMSNRSHPRP